MTLLLQVLVDGFVIGALYGLGAAGFTIIFGVSGVLNLAHGGVLVVAAMVAWLVAGGILHASLTVGVVCGVAAGVVTAYATYYLVVRPAQRSPRIPDEEREIFILTATLLLGIVIQEGIAYLFTSNPVTVPPLIPGVVKVLGVRTPINELLIGVVSWVVLGLLWVFVNRTRQGKAVLAASINPRGLAMLGYELDHIHRLVWGIYGLLGGVAGVLLATFEGASSGQVGSLTASAFIIVVLGGLGSVPGSLVAAYIVGFMETVTAYLVSPAIRTLPGMVLLLVILYLRPQGLLGRR